MSGVFLTYTRACKPGDRVQIGETLGDVQEQTFLALRIRTDRNQIVTIPSSVVLNSSVTNYTRRGLEAQTLLHTGVTIGYDAPWRTVHELLIKAALETPEVLSFPEPFVWQRALNDFYVSYELNVSTTKPERMYWILDELHRRHSGRLLRCRGRDCLTPLLRPARWQRTGDAGGAAAGRVTNLRRSRSALRLARRQQTTSNSSRPSPPAG